MPALFTVGQQTPEITIPFPHSKTSHDYLKAKIDQTALSLFKRRENMAGKLVIDAREVMQRLPGYSEVILIFLFYFHFCTSMYACI